MYKLHKFWEVSMIINVRIACDNTVQNDSSSSENVKQTNKIHNAKSTAVEISYSLRLRELFVRNGKSCKTEIFGTLGLCLER